MNEELRKKHVKEYGSFLHCPERDTLCTVMERRLEGDSLIACKRNLCVLDDPEQKALKKTIEKNQKEAYKRQKEIAKDEHDNVDKIRNQSKIYEKRLRSEIKQLEEKARELYKRSWPKQAEELERKAIYKERELRRHLGGTL